MGDPPWDKNAPLASGPATRPEPVDRRTKCLQLTKLLPGCLTPLSGSSVHTISDSFAWHGRLMVLSMGVLMPPVVIVARYFKVTPKQDWPRQLDNPFWFLMHRRWGHIIGVCVLLGLGFAASGKTAAFQ